MIAKAMVWGMAGVLSTVVAMAAFHPTRVSESGTHLETSTGETFIWLGDTAWELFHKLDREEALTYLDDRAAKGFTLIQAVILAELDGLRTPNAHGDLPLHDLDPSRPNEAYFQHVDFIVDAAAARGLVMGILPTWGDKLPSKNPGAGPLVFTDENAADFGQFLGQRYAHQPVVWILGGDRDVDYPEARAAWDAMGRAIKQATAGQQLVTYHPRGWSTSSRFFHPAPWLDFNMYQSGHELGIVPIDRLSRESASAYPRKPYVNGEPAYEDIAIRFWEHLDFGKPGHARVPPGVLHPDGTIAQPEHFTDGFVTAPDIRRQIYMSFIWGAAGYTYGNNAIWQMFKRGGDIAIPALTDWREALDRPGADAIQPARALLESRPWERLRHAPEIITGGTAAEVHAARTEDGTFAVLHFPYGGEVELHPHVTSAPEVQARWFNPRNGTTTAAGTFADIGDRLRFACPTEDEDWILLIDAAGTDFPDPEPGNP